MPTLRTVFFSLFFLMFSVQCAPLKRALSVAGKPMSMGKGFYPRATRIADKSLLGCYTAVNGENKLIQVVRSTDSGASWSPVGAVITVLSATHGLDNCYLHQLPDSTRVLAAFRNHYRDPTTKQYTSHILSVSASDDSGKTWKPLSTVASNKIAGQGVWEPFMMDGQDKSVLLFFSREPRSDGKDQNSILVRSKDSGATWGAELVISGGDRQARDGMLGVARTSPGSSELIAVFESLAPETGITSVTSPDDGKTWGNRRIVYKSTVAGARQQAPQVVLVGSTLVASFQTNEDNAKEPTNIPYTKVVASTDRGATWHDKLTVHEKCEWAGETVLDSSNLLVLCNNAAANEADEVSYAHHISLA